MFASACIIQSLSKSATAITAIGLHNVVRQLCNTHLGFALALAASAVATEVATELFACNASHVTVSLVMHLNMVRQSARLPANERPAAAMIVYLCTLHASCCLYS